MGDDAGVKEAAEEFGLQYIPKVEKNEYGTPLVSDIFRQAENHSSSKMLCYINADIIMGQDLVVAAKLCLSLWKFLAGGFRWNLDVLHEIDFSNPTWHKELRVAVDQRGERFVATGIDYFLFSRGLWRAIPPLALGRLAWDNWLLYGVLLNGGKLIDSSAQVLPIHQTHGYSHNFGKDLSSMYDGPEAKRNYELAGGGLFDLDDCRYRLESDGLRAFRDHEHVYRRLERMKMLSPRIYALMPSWKLKYVLAWLFPSL